MNDLLHWELNCCDYGFNALLGVMTTGMKNECDENASRLQMFRNPDDSSIRRFQQVSKVTYLTPARSNVCVDARTGHPSNDVVPSLS